MGVALDVQRLRDLHRARLGHPADVVAAEVEQHHVLRPLLLVAPQVLLEPGILLLVCAARPGTGYWVDGDLAVDDLDEQLRGRPDDLEAVEVKIVHVRRRVDGPEGPVYLERVRCGWARHALRHDRLDHVSGDDVLAGPLDHPVIFPARHVEILRLRPSTGRDQAPG